MACVLVEAGFTGCAVEGHSEHGQRINVNDSDWDPPLSVAVTATVSVVPPFGGSVVAVAANVAVEDPAGTVTEAGTVNAALLAETDTVVPPVGAWTERVRVQVEDAPASSVVALHANAETSTDPIRLKVAVWEALFNVAVMVTDWVVVRVPAVPAKVAEVAPAATVTEAGMVSKALLSERATLLPPVGAAWFRVTVQVVDAPEFTLVGLHDKAVTSMGATRVTLAVLEAPFRVAVTVAVWVVVMVPRLAVKVVEVVVAGTVTEAGTLSAVLLLDSASALPPVGAA
jgi:hypothetical protein